MAQKTVYIPDIGIVILAKRRGAKNIRLTIRPDGTVRIGLPHWAPYSAAIKFALSRQEWIRSNTGNVPRTLIQNGQRIGKSYRLNFLTKPQSQRTTARLGINSITISTPLDFMDTIVQKKAAQAAERALKKEAKVLLEHRLNDLAARHGFVYRGFNVKRLTSRWGSCSSRGDITLNYFLVQLPWHLIDYVIIHELAHTKHHNHGRDFWRVVEDILPNAKQSRKEIKAHRPVLLPN